MQTKKKTISTFRCGLLLFIVLLAGRLNAQMPNLNWTTTHVNTFGLTTSGQDVEVDNNGNSIIVGSAIGIGLVLDFNTSTTTDDINLNTFFQPITLFTGSDGYIAKYDPNGICLWSVHIPAIGTSTAETCGVSHVSCDAMNNVYVLGYFEGTIDCDPGPALVTYTAQNGYRDMFVAKYDANGNYIFSFVLASQLDDNPAGIVCTPNNSFHVGFYTWGGNIDLDPSPGTYSVTMAGTTGVDMVLANYSTTGSLNWGTRIGGTGHTIVNAICTNTNSDFIITGYNSGGTIDFDPGPGTSLYSTHSTCLNNAFVAKYSNTGQFNWVAHFNNSIQLYAKHWGNSVATDPAGNVYACGYLGGITDIDPSTAVYTLNPTGAVNGFLVSYSPTGNLNWGHEICSSSYLDASVITVDNYGILYHGGEFKGNVDMDLGPSTNMLSCSTSSLEVYLSKYNASNGTFVYSERLGGGNNSTALNSIVCSNNNTVHIAGNLGGTMDFDLSTGTNTLSAPVQFYLAKYSNATTYIGDYFNYEKFFDLFPNPTANSVSVNIPNLKGSNSKHLEVYNSVGELIFQKDTKDKVTNVDLSQQPAGIYFVRVDSATQKIIKQ